MSSQDSVYLKLSECYSDFQPIHPPKLSPIKPPRPPKNSTHSVRSKSEVMDLKPPSYPAPKLQAHLPQQPTLRPRCQCHSCTNLEEIFFYMPKAGNSKPLNIMIPASQFEHHHSSFTYVELDLPQNIPTPKELNKPKRILYKTINFEMTKAFNKTRRFIEKKRSNLIWNKHFKKSSYKIDLFRFLT